DDDGQGVEPDEPFPLSEADALETCLGIGKPPVADIVGRDDGSRCAIRHRRRTVLPSALAPDLEGALPLRRGEDEPVEDPWRGEAWSRLHGCLRVDRGHAAGQENDRTRPHQTTPCPPQRGSGSPRPRLPTPFLV